MEFRSIHTLETAENVHIKVELAGIANRVFAFLIDGLIMLGLLGAVSVIGFVLGALRDSQEFGRTVLPLGLFVVFFGYHLFQEWLWNGKTLGKAVFGIRVVRNNGQPIGFWEAFGRSLLRVVDVYTSGVGLLVMMFNPSEKRFGDLISGTIVINDQSVARPGQHAMLPFAKAPKVLPTESETTPEGLRLSSEEAELLKGFCRRRKRLLKEAAQRLSQGLQRYVSQRGNLTVDSDEALERLAEQAGH